MFKDSWVIYAILSAFFAALTSILAKIGISDINSNLATAIRTIQLGDASKVVPIDKFSVVISMILAFVILKEDLTFKTVMGGILITASTFVMIL